MTSIAEIEEAVARLPPHEFATFRAWFETFEADRFDRCIEDDARAGKLDALEDEALAEACRGDLREL